MLADFKKLSDQWTPQARLQIQSMTGDDVMKERLGELGFFKGQILTFIGQMPFRGPQVFQTSTTAIALRHEEAACVQVTELR